MPGKSSVFVLLELLCHKCLGQSGQRKQLTAAPRSRSKFVCSIESGICKSFDGELCPTQALAQAQAPGSASRSS